jgi:uncharacterized repeat protein (TIGR01451 family)
MDDRGLIARLLIAGCLGPALAALVPVAARAQAPTAPVNTGPPASTAAPATPPGPTIGPVVVAPILPPEVQVVRFQGPPGVKVEVLGPAPEPVPIGDGAGLATFGLRVGVGYRLRVTNIPGREGAELFPVIELVGHLHRPPTIDPGKYPIRVQLAEVDFEDVLVRGRLVTQVVYLEDPEQALPLHLPKDEIPVVSLNPAEEPLKVAAALGRVMAIVRIGGRTPTQEELAGWPICPLGNNPCRLLGGDGGRCRLPAGLSNPLAAGNLVAARDEFLCDGGDHGEPVGLVPMGGVSGVNPKDAVVRFQADARARLLPTNTVCIYAPRFAAVRVPIGPTQALAVETLRGAETLERQIIQVARQGSRKMTQNQTPEQNRHRARPSGLANKVLAGHHFEIRVLAVHDTFAHLGGNIEVRGPEFARNRQKPGAGRSTVFLQGVKLAEGTLVSGIVAGAGEQVMAWRPQELAGVEVPPNKPGLAVVKQVDATEAEPGDVVTYTIRYRNMGNVPIRAVSIVDSLMPRLEYVPRSATGPAGTVFTAEDNTAGSAQLRWDLPGVVAPGASGEVAFKARVR